MDAADHAAGALGLLGVQYPEAYGGLGLDYSYTVAVAEELGRANKDMVISASIPEAAALNEWRTQRDFIIGVTLAFATMILAAAGFAVWYMERLNQARLGIAQSKNTLDQALESMVSGFVLIDAQRRVRYWNRRFVELHPWLADLMHAKVSSVAVESTVVATSGDHGDASNWSWSACSAFLGRCV